jgi:hypothetical protein
MNRKLGKLWSRTISPVFIPRLTLIILGAISAVAVAGVIWPHSAAARECDVGVNVNSFQNFDSKTQETIVKQLVTSGVQCVRTSLRLDDKNVHLAKELQNEGIGFQY